MRIASLLASATEIVYALGLEDDLVAISHECDYPPDALRRPRVSRPRVDFRGLDTAEIDAKLRDAMRRFGSVYELDEVRLQALEPDLILTQAVCEVCAVPTSLVEQAAGSLVDGAEVLSLDSHSMDDILRSIVRVGEASGVPDRAKAVVATLQGRLERVRTRVAGRRRQRVLAIEWLDPPFLPGHWTPEMVEVAGGTLLGSTAASPSRRVGWSELAELDPDVLVVMPCGYTLGGARADADRYAEKLLAVASRAVSAGRAFVVDGSAYFNRSGPRMVDGVEILAAVLHPHRFSSYDLAGKAEVWQPPARGDTQCYTAP